MSPRQANATIAKLVLVAVALIGGTIWLERNTLFGTGGDAIHDPATVPAAFHACGGRFERVGDPQPLAVVEAGVAAVALADPAPLAPCTTPGAVQLFVRVGQDAYVEYASHPEEGCGGG